MPYTDLSQKAIKAWAAREGRDMASVAAALGVSYTTLWRWAGGKRDWPLDAALALRAMMAGTARPASRAQVSADQRVADATRSLAIARDVIDEALRRITDPEGIAAPQPALDQAGSGTESLPQSPGNHLKRLPLRVNRVK